MIATLPPSAVRAAKAATSAGWEPFVGSHSVDFPAFRAGVADFFGAKQRAPSGPATPGAG